MRFPLKLFLYSAMTHLQGTQRTYAVIVTTHNETRVRVEEPKDSRTTDVRFQFNGYMHCQKFCNQMSIIYSFLTKLFTTNWKQELRLTI